MAPRTVAFTYRDYLCLGDDKRYEILEGELMMTPAPNWEHQSVVKALFRLLDRHVETTGSGVVQFSPVDVILAETVVVQPDLIYISNARRGIIQTRGVFGPPDLVVEVVSESHPERDTELKRRIYDKYGVREYWIADPKNKTIEVLAVGKAGLETVKVYPDGASLKSPLLPGLEFPVKEAFRSDAG